jgi:hypothetical protein
LFYRVVGRFPAMEVQRHYQKIVSKQKYKKIDKKSKTALFSVLFITYHVVGRFSARGGQKHHQKNIGKKI